MEYNEAAKLGQELAAENSANEAAEQPEVVETEVVETKGVKADKK